MGIAAGDPQIRMTDLIFDEITGDHTRLHVADSAMSEGVHPTGVDSESFAERRAARVRDDPAQLRLFFNSKRPSAFKKHESANERNPLRKSWRRVSVRGSLTSLAQKPFANRIRGGKVEPHCDLHHEIETDESEGSAEFPTGTLQRAAGKTSSDWRYLSTK